MRRMCTIQKHHSESPTHLPLARAILRPSLLPRDVNVLLATSCLVSVAGAEWEKNNENEILKCHSAGKIFLKKNPSLLQIPRRRVG